MAKPKIRTVNEWFQPVLLGHRKSCPQCRERLPAGESIWNPGWYVTGRWRSSTTYFCVRCWPHYRRGLALHYDHLSRRDLRPVLVARNTSWRPPWMKMDPACYVRHWLCVALGVDDRIPNVALHDLLADKELLLCPVADPSSVAMILAAISSRLRSAAAAGKPPSLSSCVSDLSYWRGSDDAPVVPPEPVQHP